MNDLTIFAPTSGIVLFTEEKSTNNIKQLHVGSQVKKDDVLLDIGDLTGLCIEANVTENDINRLILNMPVILSFSSDLELELNGKIVSIAKQAMSNSNSGFTLFPVIIHIPKLKKNELKNIRIGMNAKIDIVIKESPAIKIPLAAVFQRDNKSFVKMIEPVKQKIVDKEVKTGSTSQNEVTILSGLKQGDKVIIDD